MTNRVLKNIVKMVCILNLIFLCTIGSSQAIDYNGIITNEVVINTIKKRIDISKVRSSYGSYAFFIDFSKIYIHVNSNSVYEVNLIIPIMNTKETKIIGEIGSRIVLSKDNTKNITALSFIENSEIAPVIMRFADMMAKFFIFGGVSCSKYIPSIFKSKETIVKKLDNTGYHYLPLKDKVD